MSDQELRQRLETLFGDVLWGGSVPLCEITRDNSPHWDSLGHANIIAAMEEDFEIQFSDDEVVSIQSFADAFRILKERTS